ncbi:MAG TPA: fibronectin type III domain-containing protein, partial [Candidatus Eisenbacteria bacterium]|nr:fibronectin type III domain-containing protein [Candidatus Eisenbacteria bacterium]
SALTATAISSSQINLAWTDNANNETGFKIERSTNNVNFTQIATVSANVTTYSNTGLSPLTTYYYRVRANNANGDSGYSNAANATTPDVVPAPPSNLTATAISKTQINLAWTDNSGNEQGFKVERSTDGVAFTQIVAVAANVTSYANTGLQGNKKYYYRVRAYNAVGNSTYSNTANAKTPPK